jgi:pimeloyl-ACP methyl ester carboxylesterase
MFPVSFRFVVYFTRLFPAGIPGSGYPDFAMPKSIYTFLLLLTIVIGLSGCTPTSTPALSEPSPARVESGNLTPGQPGTPGIPSTQFVLGKCDQNIPNLPLRGSPRCGKLVVYEDRVSQSGRQIELNIIVLPAVSRSPAKDPLFFIPGGPGEAASSSYPSISSAFEKINQKRDIVLVDQRGTGRSHPLKCDQNLEDADNVEDTAAAQALFKACLQSLDADPRFYTTPIAMDDLDQVRQELGYDQINLYGASYGTRAALVYLRRHPEHVRSIILDGVAPPEWILGPEAAGDAQEALDQIFARCAADPACQSAFPNLPAEFQGLLDRLDQGPVRVNLDHPIDGQPTTTTIERARFVNTIHQMTYSPETAAVLPVMIHDAYAQNDFKRFAALTLATEHNLGDLISPGMRMAVTCSEDEPYFNQAPASKGYLGDLATKTFIDLCAVWPKAEIPAGYHTRVASTAPALLISGGADPVTPPHNASEAAEALPNSLQIVLPGMGHINIYRGCLPKLAAQFVDQGSTQGLDISCAQATTPLPFFVNFNGPQP